MPDRFIVEVTWTNGTNRAEIATNNFREWIGRSLAEDLKDAGDDRTTGDAVAREIPDDDLALWWLSTQSDRARSRGIQIFDETGAMLFIFGPAIYAIRVTDRERPQRDVSRIGFRPDLAR